MYAPPPTQYHTFIRNTHFIHLFLSYLFFYSLVHSPPYPSPYAHLSPLLSQLRAVVCLQSCDMWSLGVVIYIMLCGYPPFYSEVPRKQLSQGMRRRIMAGEYDYPEKEWSKISSDAKDVIAR